MSVIGEADSVESAVECIIQLKPDIVLLDIEIIGGTGFDVLDKIGAGFFIIVFVTAHGNYRDESLRYPLARYLLKPVSGAALSDAIGNAISPRNV